MIDFNINDWVHVKLNQVGKDELKKQWQEYHELYPKAFPTFSLPKEDAEGFSKWQLHTLMSVLGHKCTLGLEPPFDTAIKIDN